MKKLSRTVIPRPPQKVNRVVTLPEFYELRKRVLIVRSVGGLGDILMHRMMFEDFKLLAPDIQVHFACPAAYHDAVVDHPFLDKLIDSNTVDRSQYVVHYNTSTVCGKYEGQIAPLSDLNRSDIWAKHCGLTLTRHNMHFRMSEAEIARAKEHLSQYGDKPIVLIAPVSAMETKNLLPHQLEAVVQAVQAKGYTPVGIHSHSLPWFENKGLPVISGVSTRQWMGVIHEADYVVSVDTAAFHCAGGMGKPLTGIFTWADGKIYGKHYDFELCQFHRDTHPEWTCGPCYNWCACPKTRSNPKPCLTEMTGTMISKAVNKMFEKWPKALT
jgi:hypothetical protein